MFTIEKVVAEEFDHVGKPMLSHKDVGENHPSPVHQPFRRPRRRGMGMLQKQEYFLNRQKDIQPTQDEDRRDSAPYF